MTRPICLISLLFVCGACSDDDPAPPQADAAENCAAAEGTCNLQTCAPDQLDGLHVDVCTVVDWPTNPPTSGQHYPIWAAFQDYDTAVPRGFWLHSVEHSGIVLAYNCDRVEGACADLVTALTDFAAAAPADPLCDASVGNRIIVTPDPLLDVAFAAVAWGHSLKGDCFDETLVQAFVDAHYGNNYENLCGGGVDPTDPAEGFDADCGQP